MKELQIQKKFNDAVKKYREKTGERQGQLIWNAMASAGLIEAPESNQLFYISDNDFKRVISEYINSTKGRTIIKPIKTTNDKRRKPSAGSVRYQYRIPDDV